MPTIKHHISPLFDFHAFSMKCLGISVWLRVSWNASNCSGQASTLRHFSSQLCYYLKSSSELFSLSLYGSKQ